MTDPTGEDVARLFPPFVPNMAEERRANRPLMRMLHGAMGGFVFGSLFAIPSWIRSRRVVPPKAVLLDVAEMTAVSAGGAYIECAVERFRGRSNDILAPLLGAVVPRLLGVSVSAALATRRGSKPTPQQLLRSLGSSLAFPLANELLFRLPALLNS